MHWSILEIRRRASRQESIHIFFYFFTMYVFFFWGCQRRISSLIYIDFLLHLDDFVQEFLPTLLLAESPAHSGRCDRHTTYLSLGRHFIGTEIIEKGRACSYHSIFKYFLLATSTCPHNRIASDEGWSQMALHGRKRRGRQFTVRRLCVSLRSQD